MPRYRAELFAEGEALNQAIDNFLRRIVFLPIKKTSHERRREVLAMYGFN